MVSVAKLPQSSTIKYDLNKDCQWLLSILDELNEEAQDYSINEKRAQTDISISCSMQRKFKQTYSDYILVEGKLSVDYLTECVRTLMPMHESITQDFTACFISDEYEQDERFLDQIEIFMDNKLYDLHFYSDQKLDFKQFIEELIHLNKNPYPTLDSDSPLSTNNTKQ